MDERWRPVREKRFSFSVTKARERTRLSLTAKGTLSLATAEHCEKHADESQTPYIIITQAHSRYKLRLLTCLAIS